MEELKNRGEDNVVPVDGIVIRELATENMNSNANQEATRGIKRKENRRQVSAYNDLVLSFILKLLNFLDVLFEYCYLGWSKKDIKEDQASYPRRVITTTGK